VDQKDVNQAEWRDARNWRWGAVYVAERDTRVWVPKRLRWTGWTLNFAHRAAYVWLAVLLAPAVVVLLVVLASR